MSMERRLRVAILDLNNNVPNRGTTYLKRMVEAYGSLVEYEVFDVRFKNEIPDTSFDIYISSGGPGSPYDYTGGWDKPYFDLCDKLWEHNKNPLVESKKYVFFICHSFQLACLHFKIGEVTNRKSISFGTFPCNKTTLGESESFLNKLKDPFWIADFRDWQVVNADDMFMRENGFKIVALEKERPHVDLPRAIMAIRFSDEMFGTQFHPEADADGMLTHFNEAERKAQVVNNHGEERYNQMIHDLSDQSKINHTHKVILPSFLNNAIENLLEVAMET
jgi:homoserine O-succinyltransferase/O-acetyltransferase